MSFNDNTSTKKYYPNTSPNLSKTLNFFYKPISHQDEQLLYSINTLPNEINKKTDEINNMFNTKFGKSFLNIKPRALVNFENQLKQYLLSPNNKALTKIPWLHKKILEEQRKKEENLKKKIKLGSIVYYYFRDGKKKFAINTSIMKEKYLIRSSNFASSDTKDIINEAFTKVKFWDKNAKRVSQILDTPISKRNSIVRLSKNSKYKLNEVISSNRCNDSEKTIYSLVSNIKKNKNINNNNVISEQNESLIKEVNNENSIFSEESDKYTIVKNDKNNTNSNTNSNTKSNSNKNKNFNNKNDISICCFPDISNCESSMKVEKKKIYNKIKNERNNKSISNYKYKINKTSVNFFNKYNINTNNSVSKKTKPLYKLVNEIDKNNLENTSQKKNAKYFLNTNYSTDNKKSSKKYLSSIFNRNAKTAKKNNFRSDSRNSKIINNTKSNFTAHNFSYKIQDSINERINNLNQYVRKCNDKLVGFVEHSDKILIKLEKSINKKTMDKTQVNLHTLLSDKKLNNKKKYNKTSMIKLLLDDAKRQVGVEDKFEIYFNKNKKTKRKNAKINLLTQKMIKDLNIDIN